MKILILLIFIFSVSCGNKFQQIKEVKNIAGIDPCESPDADISCNFENVPDNPGYVMNISSKTEPGIKIFIEGQILKADGKTPYPEILIYAYQTDSTGLYSKSGNETGVQKLHGKLHGWCMTDINGKYKINTVRPGKYPTNDFPAHIHWAIREPDGKMQYLNDFVFSDDKHVNEEYISKPYYKTGDVGVLKLSKNNNGIMWAKRITVLK
ncbi:MAG TPA: hypothetical protein PLX80_03290 [Ignavibacteria bacterium]|nr:hypothetical protein [Ignavibacteria bacterium]